MRRPQKEKAAAAPPKCPTFDDFEFPLRIAFHIAFASLWVACPNWSRRADGLAAFEDVRVALIRAREQAWDDYFDRENPQPMDERIGNEASLARMTALGAVEAVCYQLARAAGEVDSLGLPPPPKKDD